MAIFAQKGNKVRQIEESQIAYYVEQGFKIVDEKGAVLKETVPTDINELRLAYREHIQTIELLKNRIALLEKELQQAKAAKQPAAKEAPAEESEGKAKRAKKSE